MTTNKTIRRVTDFREQRMETYRYWQNQGFAERIDALTELVQDAYFAKGIGLENSAPNKTIVRVERPDWKVAE
jgi:hypothetical protein